MAAAQRGESCMKACAAKYNQLKADNGEERRLKAGNENRSVCNRKKRGGIQPGVACMKEMKTAVKRKASAKAAAAYLKLGGSSTITMKEIHEEKA
jgi:hypothetical protein